MRTPRVLSSSGGFGLGMLQNSFVLIECAYLGSGVCTKMLVAKTFHILNHPCVVFGAELYVIGKYAGP
jgi:hypothetical protein